MKYALVLVVIFCLFSCEKKDEKIDKVPYTEGINPLMIGTWIYDTATYKYIAYTKSDSLVDSLPGYIFNIDSSIIIRKTDDWCLTPPINYHNFSGNCTPLNDSVYEAFIDMITYNDAFQIIIVEITPNSLKMYLKNAFEE